MAMPNLRLLTLGKHIPTAWIENGGIYLELIEMPAVTRNFGEITDINEIKADSYLDLQVKRTRRSEQALLPFMTSCTNEFDLILENQFNSFPFKGQLVSAEKEFRVRIKRLKDHWSLKIGKKKVDQYALGSFDFTPSNVEAVWAKDIWADTDELVQFPMANYGRTVAKAIDGGLYAKDEFSWYVEDFRPFFSLFGTLKAIFCQEGWQLRSSLWETSWGRSVWFYGLATDFYKQKVGDKDPSRWGKALNFKAEFVPTVAFPNLSSANGVLPFTDVSATNNYDYGGNFTLRSLILLNGGSFWQNPLVFTHEYDFFIDVTIANNTAAQITVIISIELEKSTFSGSIHDKIEYEVDVPASGSVTLSRKWETNVYENDRARVMCNGGQIVQGSKFWGQVRGRHLYRGDEIELSDIVNKDLEAMELLRSLVFLCNGKIKEDYANKIIWIDPPEDGTLLINETSAKFNGHFEPELLDIRPEVVGGSVEANFDDPVSKNLIIRFQSSSDINTLDAEKDTLYSTKVEYDNGAEGEDELTCPLFEPTPNVWVPQGPIGHDFNTSSFNNGKGLLVPSLCEVDEGRGEQPNYRVVVYHGLVQQEARDLPQRLLAPFKWESPNIATSGFLRVDMPYAAQSPDAYVVLRDAKNSGSVVFGERQNDLFTLHWQKQLYSRSSRLKFSGLLNWDFAQANEFLFNKRALLDDSGQTFQVELTSIDDIDFQSNLAIPFSARVVRCRQNIQPCQCKTTSQLMFQFFAQPPSGSDTQLYNINSFEVDGTRYISSSQNLGTRTTQTIGGIQVVTNLVNLLNAANAPFFTFEAAINPDVTTVDQGKWFKVTYPSCVKFTIVLGVQTPSTPYLRLWTEKGLWRFDSSEGTWNQLPTLLPYPNPANVTTNSPKTACDAC